MKEALFYKKIDKKKVKCNLCYHKCIIKNGDKGFCNARENKDGTLFSFVYGKVIANNIDPIEKKPLFHFYPGSKTYSIATPGCNFKCLHCQNYSISQNISSELYFKEILPLDIVKNAINEGCKSISYTYTEPTIFFEYAYDIAKIAYIKNIKNIFVTNGYISKEALEYISPFLNGANIDLKAISNTFYKDICKAKIKHVLDNIKLFYDLGIWIEITTLIIPGYNDKISDIKKIANFIKKIDPNIPWHITRFHPHYKLNNIPMTKIDILDKFVKIGENAGLNFVYQGNIGKGENTYCPNCKNLIIKRDVFNISKINMDKNRCSFCNKEIFGFWDLKS
jgi:pyruvate formate lyase activating enzyme